MSDSFWESIPCYLDTEDSDVNFAGFLQKISMYDGLSALLIDMRIKATTWFTECRRAEPAWLVQADVQKSAQDWQERR